MNKNRLEMKKALARLLMDKSYIQSEVTLTSGLKSSYYFDCKQTALHPEGAYLIGHLFLEYLDSEVQGVGGMTLGADPLVTAVSLVSYLENKHLPAFIVRKQPKSHGTQSYLEGMANFKEKQKVAILEDVVTTGKSLLQACDRVNEAGLAVIQTLCLLDREEGGKENLLANGFDLQPIFLKSELF